MRKLSTLSIAVGAGAAALFALGARIAPAQDPVVINSQTVHSRLDNSRARVLESELQPGQKEQMHSHPASIIYVVSGGKVRNHLPDGTAVESTLVTGGVIYREPITHWAENIGTTTLHFIIVELKDPS